VSVPDEERDVPISIRCGAISFVAVCAFGPAAGATAANASRTISPSLQRHVIWQRIGVRQIHHGVARLSPCFRNAIGGSTLQPHTLYSKNVRYTPGAPSSDSSYSPVALLAGIVRQDLMRCVWRVCIHLCLYARVHAFVAHCLSTIHAESCNALILPCVPRGAWRVRWSVTKRIFSRGTIALLFLP